MPNTYTELRRTVVGTATNTVVFDNIPQIYTDLVLVCNFINTIGQTDHGVRFNGDTASNYSRTQLFGTGSVAGSNRGTNETLMNILGFIGTSWSVSIMQIMNYSNTTTHKTAISRANGASDLVITAAGLWRNTNAITSLNIIASGGNFAVGSTFSLYGIANADQGAAKATGGIITEDSQYWYHTFGASGVFTPKQALTCDYLVVAGGGGGGQLATGAGAGGGGAGGLRSTVTATGGGGALESALSLLSGTPYTVTIGAGGPAGSSSAGTNGVNSVFATITSTGGGGGAPGNNAGSSTGSNGGSGGGSGSATTTRTGGLASPSGQGYAGGVGAQQPTNYGGAGGGGAGAIGGNGGANGGAGGNGVATLISGTSTTYGGGGGGAISGAGGTGGGGIGGTGGGTGATAGTPNTGGGGGSGYGSGFAMAGGSGIVIVRYAK
jgi:hypothetical protein